MGLKKSDVWSFVHAERGRLVDELAEVPARAWATQSLCPGWDVHDVLAHLVDCARTSRITFARRMIAAGFDFDRDNACGIERERRSDPRDTLAAMQAVVALTRSPIAPRPTRVVEAIVHGEDIRRPLGIAAAYPTDMVVAALTYQVGTAVGVGGGRERAKGLHLVATDAESDTGRGALVCGSVLDLLMAVSGRPVDADALDGPGAARLACDVVR